MERALVLRAQRGDEAAFGDLVALVGGRLHGVARQILRDLDLADDARSGSERTQACMS